MAIDSTHLFLSTGSVGALVVYVRGSAGRGGFVPMPHQLASSLRSQDASQALDRLPTL